MLDKASTRVLVIGLTLGALAGCGEDSNSKAISQAAVVMDVQPATNAEESYATILSLLNSISDSASPGTIEAAGVLQGAAKAGLASTKSEQCQTLEFTAREMGTVVRATNTQWQRLDAQAKAAAQISVDDELAEIATLIEERRAQREINLSAKSDFDTQVAELDKKIASLDAKATEQRNKAGTLQLQISRVSATQAAALAEQIREHTLRADEFDRKASELRTTKDQITPEAREASLNVEKIEMQLQLLDRQRAEAQARVQVAQEDATNTRQAADTVASELRNIASEFTSFIDGELMDSFDAVNRELSASKQATRQARDIARTSSGLTAAITLQTLAVIESRRASALEVASRVFLSIAASGAMPDAQTTADSFHDRALEAHQASNDAYEAAASSLRSVRLSSREFRSVSQRLQDAADMLDRLAQTPFGQVPDLTSPPEEPEAVFDDGDFFKDEPASDDSAQSDEI